jgi:hypothetical protein
MSRTSGSSAPDAPPEEQPLVGVTTFGGLARRLGVTEVASQVWAEA